MSEFWEVTEVYHFTRKIKNFFKSGIYESEKKKRTVWRVS